MPIFEYQCSKCGYVNEVLVPSADVRAPACPKCGEKKVQKRFSTFSAQVKSPAGGAESKCHSCPSSGGCPRFHG